MEKTNADLQTEIVSIVESQTAPDSIKPTTLDDVLKDMSDSAWNKQDGVRVGTGAGSDSALVIPALFTATIHNNDRLRDIIQALMDANSATNILVAGGVQGQPGEFVACITDETQQTILINQNTSALGTFASSGSIITINDKDGGLFDNGNNFDIDECIIAGFSTAKIFARGFVFEIIENNLASFFSRYVKVVATIQGTQISFAESNTILVTDAMAVGTKLYFTDFQVTPTGLAGGQSLKLELYNGRNSVSTTGSIRIMPIAGFWGLKKV